MCIRNAQNPEYGDLHEAGDDGGGEFHADTRPRPEPEAEPEPDDVTVIGTGTRFLVNQDNIVTADHVLEDCYDVSVRHGHNEHLTQIAARDTGNDLGLLMLEKPIDASAKLRGGKPIRLGDVIATYGYPLSGTLSDSAKITQGNVNSLAGLENDSRVFQYDASTQPGNSGGPVLDESGNIVGVVSHRYTEESNVNFAVKSSLLENFLAANNVDYEEAESTEELKLPDIAEKAGQFTVLVACWGTPTEVAILFRNAYDHKGGWDADPERVAKRIDHLVKFEGDTKDGLPHGAGVESILRVKDEEEITIYKGEYRNGLRNGYGVELIPSNSSQYWAGEWFYNIQWFGAFYVEEKIRSVVIDGKKIIRLKLSR